MFQRPTKVLTAITESKNNVCKIPPHLPIALKKNIIIENFTQADISKFKELC